MKWIATLLFFGISQSLLAQPDKGEEALQKVLEVLTLETPSITGVLEENLQKGAWEALSYIQEKPGGYTVEDLQEAVPDYYNFLKEAAFIKLVNPGNYNEYGIELKMRYTVDGKGMIKVYDDKNNLKAEWEIIYLDGSYMAMDMGELKVFFTHTPVQE